MNSGKDMFYMAVLSRQPADPFRFSCPRIRCRAPDAAQHAFRDGVDVSGSRQKDRQWPAAVALLCQVGLEGEAGLGRRASRYHQQHQEAGIVSL